ncbi:MAG: hypothetical protein VKP57_09070, partial [Candidatus Sericytochromatia bacterium]|nr:hypothetical protein [Candidatus Sericytochromatia bacterium]
MSGKINRPPVGGTGPLDPGRARSGPLTGAGAEEAPQGRAAEPASKPMAKDRLSAAKQVPSDAGQAIKGELDRILKKRPKPEPTPAEKPEIGAQTLRYPEGGQPVPPPVQAQTLRFPEGGQPLPPPVQAQTLRFPEGGQPPLEGPGVQTRRHPEGGQPPLEGPGVQTRRH